MDASRPLFTYFVYAFNHEKYIREAIESAFSQTYTPLEIILSDDCSTDNTWQIMQEMAQNYTGPNRIILNRNEKNMGISYHLNRIMQLGKGDWFVLGAGDDISLPVRVQTIYDAIKKHPNAYGVATALININEGGKEIGNHNFDLKQPYLTGASSAWHRKCFEYFGEIRQSTTAEDVIIPFRSVLLGDLLLMKTPTVKYRYHEQSISNPLNMDLLTAWQHLEKIKYQLVNACKQRLLDLEKAKPLIQPPVYEALKFEHQKLIKGFEDDIENINLRCVIWKSALKGKFAYLIDSNKNLPDKHHTFAYRLKTFIASFKWAQFILKVGKSKNHHKDIEQQAENIRTINIQDLLKSDIGLLIYL